MGQSFIRDGVFVFFSDTEFSFSVEHFFITRYIINPFPPRSQSFLPIYLPMICNHLPPLQNPPFDLSVTSPPPLSSLLYTPPHHSQLRPTTLHPPPPPPPATPYLNTHTPRSTHPSSRDLNPSPPFPTCPNPRKAERCRVANRHGTSGG